MDDNNGNWKKAMGEEKMFWSQYIVDKDKLDLVRTQSILMLSRWLYLLM